MKRCLFTYEPLLPTEKNYSRQGLALLSKKLSSLKVLSLNQDEQLQMARKMVTKISIQGIQPKFSLMLSEKDSGEFISTDKNGRYILKPQVRDYENLPENEDLTMHLAQVSGVQTPWHGLIRCSDESLSYVIRRFDRTAKSKIPVEDFAQVIGASRYTKYDVSMEKVVEAIELHCTYPTLEGFKLFQRVILAFLLGNEDFHLKNISLISTAGKNMLSPIYDFVNSTIALDSPEEEMALSICGKKSGFTKKDFVEGFAVPTLFLPSAKAEKEIQRMLGLIPVWKKLIKNSFLSANMKKKYEDLINARAGRLTD